MKNESKGSACVRAEMNEDIRKFADRLRNASKFIRHNGGFDDAMIYSMISRIKNIVKKDLNDIEIVKCSSKKTIIKKLSNLTFVRHYNTETEKRIRIYKQTSTPVWGFPTVSEIVSVMEMNGDNDNVIYKNKTEPPIYDTNKIYIVLLTKATNDNHVRIKTDENGNTIHDIGGYSSLRYELALIKSDISSNNRI